MGSIADTAANYEAPKPKNIADLELVRVEWPIELLTKEGTMGKYTKYFVMHEGEEYYTPYSVMNDLKAILKAKPNMKTFKVIKKGEGKEGTSYTVVPID